jgi:type II secretory pathway component GspD/PulD (secretin)
MKMSRQRWTALVVAALAATTLAAAQNSEGRQPRSPQDRPATVQREGPRRSLAGRVRVEQARPQALKNAQVSSIKLRHADAESVAEVLQQLRPAFPGSLFISPEERTATLVVAAENEETIRQIKSLIEALDEPARGEMSYGRECHSIELKHAVAVEVLRHLRVLVPDGRGLRVTADQRSNTIWVAAAPELAAQALQIVHGIEESTAEAEAKHADDPPALRFYQVKHANATALASTANQVARMMELEACLVADPASGQIIVYATSGEAEQLERVIEKLDVSPKQTQKPPASHTPHAAGRETKK